MTAYSYDLKIPKERVAVLIGKKGDVKKGLEESTKTKISVDSKEGDVTVAGEDALALYTAREVIKAVGRGFNPETAELLLKQDYAFELMYVLDYARNKDDMARVKGRLIGKEGKSRRHIEELSECNICVFGKTVGIIGRIENVTIARRAIENLLKGAPHRNVYSWLEKQRTEMKKRELLG